MDNSIRNAKKLAIIGFIQIIPFTLLSILGFMGIAPPIVWALGMILFVFYVKHAWGNIYSAQTIRRLWLGSIVFNGIGLVIPFYTVYLIFLGIGDLISIGSIRDDEMTLAAFLVVWSLLICTHVWLSVSSLKSLNAEEEISYSFENLVTLPKFLQPDMTSMNE